MKSSFFEDVKKNWEKSKSEARINLIGNFLCWVYESNNFDVLPKLYSSLQLDICNGDYNVLSEDVYLLLDFLEFITSQASSYKNNEEAAQLIKENLKERR